MQTSGLCRQRHFPAVAQPFRVLWAPWAPALFFFFSGLFMAVLGIAFIGSQWGTFLMIVGVIGGHLTAISVGLKFRYMASIVTGLENRRTGSNNLSEDDRPTQYNFSNI